MKTKIPYKLLVTVKHKKLYLCNSEEMTKQNYNTHEQLHGKETYNIGYTLGKKQQYGGDIHNPRLFKKINLKYFSYLWILR